MAARPFAYNPTQATIEGTTNVGTLCVGVSALDYSSNPGGLTWWMGPDEDNSYVVCKDVSTQNFPTPVGDVGSVQFWRSTNTDEAFRSLVQTISGTSAATASAASDWLLLNGYWTNYDAQAFINAASITNTTQKTAIDTLVNGLKADSIWTKMKAIYPFVGGTASTHKFNLKDPRDLIAAYRLTFSGGWTHNSNGITGNGTNSFAESYYFPITINTIGAYNRTAATNQTLLGATFTGVDNDGFQTNPIGLVLRGNSVSPGYIGTTFSAGIPAPAAITVSRTAADGATAIKVYRNGTQNSTGNNSEWQLLVTNGAYVPSMIIGARRQDDYDYDGFVIASNYYDYTTANIAFSFMGDTALTATEVTNLNTRIQAFQTTLNRQV